MMPDPSQPPQPSPVRAKVALPFDIWGATDRGRRREVNEDSIYPNSISNTSPLKPETIAARGQLLLVADGVGGRKAGRQASQWVIRVATESYYDHVLSDLGEALRASIETANVGLYQYLQSTGNQGAGATTVGAVIDGNQLHVANVGDSRAYLIRDGQLYPLTRDHTLTQQKLAQNLITVDQVDDDPDHNVLVRSMGLDSTVEVDLFPPLELASGDRVLLCSDGLTDMAPEKEILDLVSRGSARKAAERLIDAANRHGGRDNISVIVAQIEGTAAGRDSLLAGLPRAWRIGLSSVLGVIVLAVLFLFFFWGWQARGETMETPAVMSTVSAPLTETPLPLTTPMPTWTALPTGTPTSTVAATSTLLPTNTTTVMPSPTSTSQPPTPTPAPSETPESNT